MDKGDIDYGLAAARAPSPSADPAELDISAFPNLAEMQEDAPSTPGPNDHGRGRHSEGGRGRQEGVR